LRGEEEEGCADHDPLAEVDDALERVFFPAEGVADARRDGGDVAEDEAVDGGDDLAADDGPDGRPEVGPDDGDDEGDDGGGAVYGEETADAHVAREREQVGAVEAAYQRAAGEYGKQGFQMWVVVVEGHWPSDGDGDDPKGDAAQGL